MPSIEHTVAGISEAGNDEFIGIQNGIDRTDVNGDIGMFRVQGSDPILGGDDADNANVGNSPAFESRDGDTDASSGGQHGIQDNSHIGRAIFGKLAIVFDWQSGRFVSVHPQVPDLGFGQKLEDRVHQSQAGSQNGDNRDTLREFAAGGFFDRGLNSTVLQLQILGGFRRNQHGYQVDLGSKKLWRSVFVTQNGQMMLNERVVQNSLVIHGAIAFRMIGGGTGHWRRFRRD